MESDSPGPGAHLFRHGMNLLNKGDRAGAASTFQRVLAKDPKNAECHHLLGVLALQDGRFRDAAEAIAQAIACDPSNAAFHNNLGIAFRDQGRRERARAAFRAAIDIQPQYAVALFNLAALEHQLGELRLAETLYQQGLAAEPGQARARANLGAVLLDQGKAREALNQLRQAVQAEPSAPSTHYNMGNAFRQLGDLDQAKVCYREAFRRDARFSLARRALAETHYRNNECDEAEAVLTEALRNTPNEPEFIALLGSVKGSQGKLAESVSLLRQAAAARPGDPLIRNNLGNVLAASGESGAAQTAYREAIAIEPGLAESRCGLGDVLRGTGEFAEAEKQYRAVLKLEPHHERALLGLGLTLKAAGRLSEAEAAYRQVIALNPGSARAYNNLGSLLNSHGEFERATEALDHAIRLDPSSAIAIANRVTANRGLPEGYGIAEIEALLDRQDLPPQDRVSLHFSLAEALDRLDETERAFAHYEAGNALKRAELPFDAKQLNTQIESLKRTFTQAFFQERADRGVESDRPIFILGMPRSGTTLVEQILASHPAICGAGELQFFHNLERQLDTGRPDSEDYPGSILRLGASETKSWASDYLRLLETYSNSAAFVTDKMPHNFLRLGLIALLFPRARIIYCRRDPMDVCLSCFFQNFAAQQPYTNGLASLGFFYRWHVDLMSHWQDVLPNPMLTVTYEDMIEDSEAKTLELLKFCGLEWDERCRRFYETDRAVQTASVWQVRQPIYQSSIGRWKRYEKHLGPLIDALAGT